jgi:hypothetical protein
MDKLKTVHFNTVKKALEHKDNEEQHLIALRKLVINYENNFGVCNLSNLLWFKYFNVFNKIMFNQNF